MKYVVTDARFLFFDGKTRYTVEYTFGISMWFVFNDRKQSDAVYKIEDKKIRFVDVNLRSAENILDEYLETLKK